MKTAALWGLDAFPVDCEVDVGPGLPGFVLVGRPDPAAREVRELVWPALRHSGFGPPDRKVTVNLAPADRPKEGASTDLAVALGVLAAMEQVPHERLARTAALGELSLDGRVRHGRGTLALAEATRAAGAAFLLCPTAAAPEAALIEGLIVHPISHLEEAAGWLRGAELPRQGAAPNDEGSAGADDLAEVRGQAVARRALEIAAAGGHHLLLVGPPGAGKSMLAQRLAGILPPLSFEEALEVTRLHSLAGVRGPGRGLMRRRPLRQPHHSISSAGMIGGGSPPRPGELSLAHHGVLFLDELSLVPRLLLDALREPLETGAVWLARAGRTVCYPARALIVAAMNPCRCGWLGHPKRGCNCTPTEMAQHHAKVSGPVLDRLDLQVEVPALTSSELMAAHSGEPSAAVRERVIATRARQRERGMLNARMPNAALEQFCALDAPSRRLVEDAIDRGGMSARGVHRALRVARTIADLANEDRVSTLRLAEALQYRAYEARRFAGP